MARFRKKSAPVEATQWFKLGDHPVVTEFRPEVVCPKETVHPKLDLQPGCGRPYAEHGWIVVAVPEGEPHLVCPGDWVITEGSELFVRKRDVFATTYEPVVVETL
jgi:hypothetical protein